MTDQALAQMGELGVARDARTAASAITVYGRAGRDLAEI